MAHTSGKAPPLPRKLEERDKRTNAPTATPNAPRELPATPAARGGAEILMADRLAAEEAAERLRQERAAKVAAAIRQANRKTGLFRG